VSVFIFSEPEGAVIFLDGVRQNRPTPARLDIPIGHHTIALEKDELRGSQEIDLDEGITIRSITIPLNP
jgi:hypothetical protein